MTHIINTENGHILDSYEGIQYSNIEKALHEITVNGYKATGTYISGNMLIIEVVKAEEA